ncbi:ATP-binding cassette domain-containing protein [Streptomyces sp. V1I1]|uniref:ABC transporter permease subunit n=1 Tax=Streptomyces sp. V1I1 TaxID=3042272 RepID=UPI00277F92A4|nr:ATP-binding cassette domain-containing protein [Streptomyces sp. V1I1]MDQ0944509.1 ABC-type branched-subunit amino acid transport system ATPase component/branched-subunit amino acid ABC-type transport system permease component [Streptomyces sp. V1I1]
MSSLTYDLTLAGLAVGSAAALTGIGLIVTYRATGVLNLAHGAIAMVCAYVLRQFAVEWGWPLPLAAAVTLLVVAPGIGLVLDRLVFRPIAVLDMDPGRALVASIGVFVLLVGGAALVWGGGARADAPVLLPDDPWVQLSAVLLLAGLVTAVTRWTRFGRELRAVVDNRALAALGGIDADRVSAVGWAFGSFTAGVTGVLLVPYVRLDPYGLPLLVVEVIAVAVIARMRSLPVAVAAALAIGVAQAQLTRLHPSGWGEPLLQAVGANLFVVALLIAALVLPGVGARDTLARPAAPAVRVPGVVWLVAAILFLLPLGFAGSDLHTSIQVPALAVILLSLVVVTGRGGQISLGQAAYAGLGALFTALLAAGRFPGLPAMPELLALVVAVLLVAPLGLLTGWPAIGRHGLALALATLAVGVGVSRFVFAQPYATAGLSLSRPAGLSSDRAFYVVELAVLAGALLAVGALRRGRTGRALAAMRDHEPGASAAGVPVPALKLLAFVTGAALAALGGGLLGMGLRAFDPSAYDPVRGLLWFAAVVVLGADNLVGPLVAAALLVGLDAGARGGVAAAVIGILAILIGRFPDAPSRTLRRLGLTEAGRGTAAGLSGRAKTPAARRRPPGPGEDGPGATGPTPAPGTPAHRPSRSLPTAPQRQPTPHAHTLVARRVRLDYGDYTALDGVDLVLPSGQVTALIGANGAGKSTLFHCLCGTLRPDSGRVELDGVDITRRAAHARTRLGIARTFQQLAVFPSLTVEENVRIGAEQGRRRDPEAVGPVLRLLGLDGPVRHRAAAGLSTGALRRTELGRALAGGPHTLLLDEPAAGLDAVEAEGLARILSALAADGMAVLVVEHDLDLVAHIAHTVHVMAAGRIVR